MSNGFEILKGVLFAGVFQVSKQALGMAVGHPIELLKGYNGRAGFTGAGY